MIWSYPWIEFNIIHVDSSEFQGHCYCTSETPVIDQVYKLFQHEIINYVMLKIFIMLPSYMNKIIANILLLSESIDAVIDYISCIVTM